jgi:hypothetical protein
MRVTVMKNLGSAADRIRQYGTPSNEYLLVRIRNTISVGIPN